MGSEMCIRDRMLIESMRAFGLEAVEVSEHDILRGAALQLATQP